MSGPKTIDTSYDLDAHPGADEFDPIAWFEGTGEDLGLPGWYTKPDFGIPLTPEDEAERDAYLGRTKRSP